MNASPSSTGPSRATITVAGAQHAVAMFAGVVMVPLLVARQAGFDAATTIGLTTAAVWVSGLTTLLQASRLGPIGSGYLCVMGSSALFIGPCVAAGKAGGPGLIFGMSLAMAPIQVLAGYLVPWLRRLAEPAVVGAIILLIGLGVVPISLVQFAGGYGPGLGAGKSLLVGGLTVLVTLLAAFSGNRWLHISSILVGLAFGYVLGACLGLVDWTPVHAAPWFGFPVPLRSGLAFDVGHILPFALAYVVTSIETFGDMNTIAEISEGSLEKADDSRIRGGLLADAVGSMLAGLFGTTPNTSYSGNLAIVQLTGVTARVAGLVAGAILILLGFVPKLGAIVAAMPAAAVGGGMLVAVAMLLGVGMRIAMRGGHENRNLMIVGLACAFGAGAQNVPQVFQHAPDWLAPLCGSGTALGGLLAILLHVLLPRAKSPARD
jgi:NCS2 family nucleobase:cation symporter-2/xanthine permease XanP